MHLFSGRTPGNCQISINKCCLLNVGKNSHGIVVSIGGSTLPVVTHTRDLGIIVSSDLSPSLHVTDIVSKAHMRSALITGGPRGPSPLSGNWNNVA